MIKFVPGLFALAFVASAGYAATMDGQRPAQDNQAPAAQNNAQASSYMGVDTDGKREDVQAPYGGRNQSQADRKEAPITERLNEQALQAATPPK